MQLLAGPAARFRGAAHGVHFSLSVESALVPIREGTTRAKAWRPPKVGILQRFWRRNSDWSYLTAAFVPVVGIIAVGLYLLAGSMP